jgi:cell division transport system permease protein
MSALWGVVRRSLALLGKHRRASAWAVAAIAAALVGVAATRLAAEDVAAWSHGARAQASMVVYLDEGATLEQADQLAQRLRARGGVDGVAVVSSTEASDRLRVALGAHDQLLDGVEPASLPISLEITLAAGTTDVAAASPVVAELRAAAGIEDVEITRDASAPLADALARLARLAWALFVVVGVGGVIAVAAAIRLHLAADRAERATLQLLGAGPLFTRAPTWGAGLWLGVAGAAVALVVGRGLAATAELGSLFATQAFTPATLGVVLALGAGIGLAGGVLAGARDA